MVLSTNKHRWKKTLSIEDTQHKRHSAWKTPSIMTRRISIKCHYAEGHNAKYCIFSLVCNMSFCLLSLCRMSWHLFETTGQTGLPGWDWIHWIRAKHSADGIRRRGRRRRRGGSPFPRNWTGPTCSLSRLNRGQTWYGGYNLGNAQSFRGRAVEHLCQT
jgi:hypothetical protein